jgi:hypothetical protein
MEQLFELQDAAVATAVTNIQVTVTGDSPLAILNHIYKDITIVLLLLSISTSEPK